jgi:glycine dehydrogenase subunit 1
MRHFLPNSEHDREEMLRVIGVSSFGELLQVIPEEARLKGELNLPPALSELEARRLVMDLSARNRQGDPCFMGAGAYDHFVPSAVHHISGRPEFYTAYTPYQAEVSQGTLQAMYEFQSLICALTGMDLSNSSMYDGASALAEAVLMSSRIGRGRTRILHSEAVHPSAMRVVKSYLSGMELELVPIPIDDGSGRTDLDALRSSLNDDACVVLLQHPNFFGVLEDPFEAGRIAHDAGALLVSYFDPISLGILAPPGAYDADIAVGEGQSLGLPLSFGGPYLGLFTSREKYLRLLPGRISGATVDVEGKKGFVMALQTREQHIRRERATSNICTNQMLCATAAAAYLSLMGKQGLTEVARQCLSRAHYLAETLAALNGVSLRYTGPFFKEFVLRVPGNAADLCRRLKGRGLLAGVPLSRFRMPEDLLMVAVTEKRTKAEMDALGTSMAEELQP